MNQTESKLKKLKTCRCFGFLCIFILVIFSFLPFIAFGLDDLLSFGFFSGVFFTLDVIYFPELFSLIKTINKKIKQGGE